MESSSNIITNDELCNRFYREALKVTNSLKYRFFSVFEKMTAEDIVMECYVKILKGNISYDDTKGCKFETFVRMLVTCQLTDELKWLNASKRSAVVVSLDSEVVVDGDDELSTLYNTVGDLKSQNSYEYLEVKQDLEKIERDLYSSNRSILDLSEAGYTIADIASMSDSERAKVRNRLKEIKEVYLSRCNGTSMQIAEILYGDDDIREKKRDYLLSISSLIVDDKTGVKLSEVIKLVLKDYSYKKISEKLDMSIKDVKRFLTRYESVMI